MPQMPNYIPDTNPFGLAGPPMWWLRRLWEFDDSLAVVPSRQGFMYRLAQKRKIRLTEALVNDAIWKESDTQMLASHGLVPVTTILSTANWGNPLMFKELAERCPWRMGGAEKVEKDILAREAEAEQKKQAVTDDMLTQSSKDGWKLYRKKIGLGRTWHASGLSPRVS